MFKKFNENRKKGFTLVELIVVLVILAILAALLIPALTGYIDKAKNKSLVAETRQAVMAAQTLVDEQYGKVNPGTDVSGNVTADDIKNLSEVPGTVTDFEVDDTVDSPTFMKVTKLVYQGTNGKTCTYEPANSASNSDGDYNVTKTSTTTP